jgi:hypothetical protein
MIMNWRCLYEFDNNIEAMQWTQKIELAVGIAFGLLALPCLCTYLWAGGGRELGLDLLVDSLHLIGIEIALLVLLAVYFVGQ